MTTLNGIQSLDFEQTRERKGVYGMRRDGTPLGKTAGKYGVKSFNMKFLVASYDTLTDYLTPIGLGSYGDAEFSVHVQYIENEVDVITYDFGGCTIDGEKESPAEGNDELTVDVTIGCLSIIKNGKTLFSVARGIPS